MPCSVPVCCPENGSVSRTTLLAPQLATQPEASQHSNCQLLSLPLSAQVNASTSARLPARLSQPDCAVHWHSSCRPAFVHILGSKSVTFHRLSPVKCQRIGAALMGADSAQRGVRHDGLDADWRHVPTSLLHKAIDHVLHATQAICTMLRRVHPAAHSV